MYVTKKTLIRIVQATVVLTGAILIVNCNKGGGGGGGGGDPTFYMSNQQCIQRNVGPVDLSCCYGQPGAPPQPPGYNNYNNGYNSLCQQSQYNNYGGSGAYPAYGAGTMGGGGGMCYGTLTVSPYGGAMFCSGYNCSGMFLYRNGIRVYCP